MHLVLELEITVPICCCFRGTGFGLVDFLVKFGLLWEEKSWNSDH